MKFEELSNLSQDVIKAHGSELSPRDGSEFDFGIFPPNPIVQLDSEGLGQVVAATVRFKRRVVIIWEALSKRADRLLFLLI